MCVENFSWTFLAALYFGITQDEHNMLIFLNFIFFKADVLLKQCTVQDPISELLFYWSSCSKPVERIEITLPFIQH